MNSILIDETLPVLQVVYQAEAEREDHKLSEKLVPKNQKGHPSMY
jgi:hypothetical protein